MEQKVVSPPLWQAFKPRLQAHTTQMSRNSLQDSLALEGLLMYTSGHARCRGQEEAREDKGVGARPARWGAEGQAQSRRGQSRSWDGACGAPGARTWGRRRDASLCPHVPPATPRSAGSHLQKQPPPHGPRQSHHRELARPPLPPRGCPGARPQAQGQPYYRASQAHSWRGGAWRGPAVPFTGWGHFRSGPRPREGAESP